MAVRAVITEVMEEKGVTAEEIPTEPRAHFNPSSPLSVTHGSKRYFSVKAFARYRAHEGCSRTWASAHSWAIMDLKEQCLIHKFTQDCQKCNGEVPPDFDEDSVRRMAEYAVDTYLRRCGRLSPRVRDPFDFDDLFAALDDRGPHDEGRCAMCRIKGRSCWK